MSKKTWITRLQQDPEAIADLCRRLSGSGIGRPDSRLMDTNLGTVTLQGETFAAAAVKLADSTGALREFFKYWGVYADPSERLGVANSILFEMGFRDE